MSEDATHPDDPLEIYDCLRLEGRAPSPEQFCAQYPEQPNLLCRIQRLLTIDGVLRKAIGDLAPKHSQNRPNRIGPYILGEKLGAGGMGAVFEAYGEGSSQPLALKLLNISSETALKRFKREAQCASALEHPGIARVFAFGQDGKHTYIVSEKISGSTLKEEISSRDASEFFEIKRVLNWIAEVAEALAYAHSEGVVHRDIKPSNLMRSEHNRIKLIDFGLAIHAHKQDELITGTGIFVGSHNYAPPEQLLGQRGKIGTWSDTYSLGATLFELLTLRTPFAFPTFAARAMHAQQAPAHGPQHFHEQISEDLNNLLLKALSPKPRHRFQDARDFADALKKLRS